MYGCESWTVKKAERRRIDAFELWCWRRLLRVPWTARRSEGDQPWDFFGRNDAKAETSVLWPPHAKSWLIGKDSDAGRDWGQGEKGTTEDEMAGWHHWLDGRESKWTPRDGDGQGAWCATIHGVAKSQTRLSDWTELNLIDLYIQATSSPGARESYSPSLQKWVSAYLQPLAKFISMKCMWYNFTFSFSIFFCIVYYVKFN